jgi:hypothetical protein
MIFRNGQGIVITSNGPGKVHLLSYASNAGIVPHEGTTTTNREGVTRFVISHSYTFTKFAFFWEGVGQAFCAIGEDNNKVPVGTSWTAATCIAWSGSSFTSENVSSCTAGGVNRDNQVTCFIIPDNLPSQATPEPAKPVTQPAVNSVPLVNGTYTITNVRQLKSVSLNGSSEGTSVVGGATNAAVTDNFKVRLYFPRFLQAVHNSYQVEHYSTGRRNI